MSEKLTAEHDAIRATVARLTALLEAAEIDLEAVHRTRWQLARGCMQHLMHEERALLEPLATSGDPVLRAGAERSRAALDRVHRESADHVAAWPAERIERDPRGFLASLRPVLTAIVAEMDSQERHLFRHAGTAPQSAAVPRNWAAAAWPLRDAMLPRRAG
jgi:hypothetical protein